MPAKPTAPAKPAVVAKADQTKKANSNRLPEDLRARTEKVDETELAKRVQGLIQRHGDLTAKQLVHCLYWAADPKAGRVPTTEAKVQAALEALRKQVAAKPRQTRPRKAAATAR